MKNSSIVLPVVLALCITIVQSHEILSDRWRELDSGKPLSFNETYDLIKELREYYRGRSESGSSSRRNRLDSLLWVKEINDEKCTELSWIKYLDQLERFEFRKLNLIPYIIHAKDALADHCENRTNTNWYKLDLKKMQELYDEVFAERGANSIGHERTLKELRRLQDLMRNLNHGSFSRKREKIDKLVDLSELNGKKCAGSSWDTLSDLRDSLEKNELNILPYINFWQDKREMFCKEKERNSDTFSPNTSYTYDQLYEKIFRTNSSSFPLGNMTTRHMLRMLHETINHHPSDVPSFIRLNVEKLVAIGDYNQQNCTRESYNDYLALVERNRAERLNIIPYLMHAKENIARFCKDKAEINYFDQDPFDWKRIHDQVFGSNALVVGPNKTLELLKQLQDIYSNRTDRSSLRRREPVDRLINLSQLTSDKCSKNSWYDLNLLYENHKLEERNVKPYLNHWRSRLERYCAGKGNWYEADIAKWQEIEDQIYDSSDDGVPLGEEKTLELMKQLRDQYLQYAEEYTTWKRRKLSELIEMSKISKDKCDEKYAAITDRLMKYNQDSSVNIVPYMRFWQNAQIKICER